MYRYIYLFKNKYLRRSNKMLFIVKKAMVISFLFLLNKI